MNENKSHKRKRTCIVCKKRYSKNELLKFVLTKNTCEVVPQNAYKPGRGFYVCPNVLCFRKFEKIIRKKIINMNYSYNVTLKLLLESTLEHYNRNINVLITTSKNSYTPKTKTLFKLRNNLESMTQIFDGE